jgi:hypothetical protein
VKGRESKVFEDVLLFKLSTCRSVVQSASVFYHPLHESVSGQSDELQHAIFSSRSARNPILLTSSHSLPHVSLLLT